MLKATLKGLLARKMRLTLAGFAVVLGVMAVSAAMVTTATIGSGFDSIFASTNANIDVSVSGKSDVDSGMGGKGFTPPVAASDVARIEKIDGVRSATGQVSVDGARPVGHDGKVIAVQGPPRSGVAWHGETGLVELWQGRGPKADNEVAINGGLADRGQYKVGETIDVLTLAPRQSFTIVGIYGYTNGRGSMGGDTQVAFTEPVAQKLMLGKTGVFSSITVTAAAGVSKTELRDRVAKALGSGFTVRTGDELAAATAADGKAFLEIVRMVLLGFSGLSLLVGIFLILNTFNILVAQRTGELALMSALGARRTQIVGSVLVEAVLVGAGASLVGIGLGIGVSTLLKMVMEANSGASLPVGLIVPVGQLVLAFLLGVAVTVVAALLPAVKASRVPPVQAMRASAAEQRSLTRITWLGAVPTVAGIGAVVASLADIGSLRWVALAGGVVLALFGLALLTPILSRSLLPGIGRLVGWSMPSKLGNRNAARNPRRTAITVSTLVITLGLVGGVSVLAQSMKADLSGNATRDLGADLVISGDGVTARAGGAGQTGPPTAADGRIMPTFAPGVIDEARDVPGVAVAVAQYVDTVQLKSGPTPAAAADLSQLSSVLKLTGSPRTPAPGSVVVDEDTLSAQGLKVGDTIAVATQRAGWKDFRITGSYEASYMLRGPVFNPSEVASLFVSDQPAIGYVQLSAGADATAVSKAVSRLVADNPEVSVQDQTQLATDAANQVSIAETMLYVLLGLSVVIGILGIINTMALSILERTRELGLLRAIGMRRSHMVQMVVTESVLMSLFGAVLGLVAGGAAGVAVAKVLGLSALEIPWGSLVVFLGLAVVAGLLAALAPSTRAAKVNVLSAIAHE
jgi:putative ABC transport system permease protein